MRSFQPYSKIQVESCEPLSLVSVDADLVTVSMHDLLFIILPCAALPYHAHYGDL